MNSKFEARVIEANGGRDNFRWMEHTEQLRAMSAENAKHAEERAALVAETAELERKLAAARHRQDWLDGLELVAAGFAEVRSRLSYGGGFFIYLRDPKSPTRVSGLTSGPMDEQHEREARSASPTGTIYASAAERC